MIHLISNLMQDKLFVSILATLLTMVPITGIMLLGNQSEKE